MVTQGQGLSFPLPRWAVTVHGFPVSEGRASGPEGQGALARALVTASAADMKGEAGFQLQASSGTGQCPWQALGLMGWGKGLTGLRLGRAGTPAAPPA